MVKNVIESDFWSNGHCQPFCEQKWPGSHIYHNNGRWRSFNLSSNCIDLKMASNAIKSDFPFIQNGLQRPFYEKHLGQ